MGEERAVPPHVARPKEPVLSSRHRAPGPARGSFRPRHALRGRGRAFVLISVACGLLLVAAPLALLISGMGGPGSGSEGSVGGGSDGSDDDGGGTATITSGPRQPGIAAESASSPAARGALPAGDTTVVGDDVPANGLAVGGTGTNGSAVGGMAGSAGSTDSGSGGGDGTPTTTAPPELLPVPVPVGGVVGGATDAVGGLVP